MATTEASVGLPFCASQTCELHIYANDIRIRGAGNWAVLPSGLIFSRVLVNGNYYCDRCALRLNTQPLSTADAVLPLANRIFVANAVQPAHH